MSETPGNALRASIVGYGNIGPVHARAIASGGSARIEAICDIDPLRRESAAASWPGTRIYADFAEMLSRERPDSVHVCTPHHLHASMARAALRSGAHVLMEKPMALDLAEGQALAAEWRASGRLLGLCFQNRYRPALIEARRRLATGELGAILGIKAVVAWKRDAAYYGQGGGWRGKWETEGGSAVINQAIHSLDLIQWLGGGCRDSRGIAGNLTLAGVIETEDSAVIALDLACGGRGLLFASNGWAEDSPVDLEILCERARLRITDALYLSTRESNSSGETAPRAEPVRLAPDESAAQDGRKAYWGAYHEALIADFYDCARRGAGFPLDPEEGLKTLRILEGFYAGAGRAPRRAGR
ncbi:MAG: Gfo/Idh/MocA family oxidoreductase [Spirochaetaceae bacterium]|nr:Gfo/Idh/MocA family oxidoreductase [Spirochaetaceae bacterium]